MTKIAFPVFHLVNRVWRLSATATASLSREESGENIVVRTRITQGLGWWIYIYIGKAFTVLIPCTMGPTDPQGTFYRIMASSSGPWTRRWRLISDMTVLGKKVHTSLSLAFSGIWLANKLQVGGWPQDIEGGVAQETMGWTDSLLSRKGLAHLRDCT